MNTPLINTQVSRRRIVQGAAWAVPAVAFATAAPSASASAPAAIAGDLAISVVDPAADGSMNTPIYWGATTQVAQYGDMPPAITITNVGSTTVTNATGTLELQMQNMDGTSQIAYRTQAREYVGTFVLTDTTPLIPATTASRTYNWTLTQTLAPGQSVTIPFQYFTPKTFANPDFSVLVYATVNDTVAGDWNDTDARVGFVPAYSSSIFAP